GLIPPDTFWIFVGLPAIAGITAAIYNASFTMVRHGEIRPELTGRVFSLYFSIAIILHVIGLLGTAWAAELLGVNNSLIVLRGVIVLVGVLSFLNKSIMGLRRKG